MTFKQKLTQFSQAWQALKTKITTKLTNQTKTITETNTKLNESQQRLQQSQHKLELQAKENSENEKVLEVLAGRYEGSMCSAEDVEQISKLPSRDEMRAQLLSAFEAPLAQVLAVTEALLTSVMHCLENKSQQNQSENQ